MYGILKKPRKPGSGGQPQMSNIGQTFGCITVDAYAGSKTEPSGRKTSVWKCHCEKCGSEYIRTTRQIKDTVVNRCYRCPTKRS